MSQDKLSHEDLTSLIEKQRIRIDNEYKSLVQNLNNEQMMIYQMEIKDFVTMAVGHLYKKMITSMSDKCSYNLVDYANIVDDLLANISQCIESEDLLALEKYHEQINKTLDKFICLH